MVQSDLPASQARSTKTQGWLVFVVVIGWQLAIGLHDCCEMVGNRFRWLNDGSSFVQGNNRLPIPVMLAWAKAKNETIGKLKITGNFEVPWPTRDNHEPSEFPMKEFVEDGNFVVNMFCKFLGVGSDQVPDLSKINV